MNVLHKTAITLTPSYLDIFTKKKRKTHIRSLQIICCLLQKIANTLFNKKATALNPNRSLGRFELKAVAIFFINKRKGAIS